MSSYLNFLLIERNAVNNVQTRLLVRLRIRLVCIFEDHLVFGTIKKVRVSLQMFRRTV